MLRNAPTRRRASLLLYPKALCADTFEHLSGSGTATSDFLTDRTPWELSIALQHLVGVLDFFVVLSAMWRIHKTRGVFGQVVVSFQVSHDCQHGDGHQVGVEIGREPLPVEGEGPACGGNCLCGVEARGGTACVPPRTTTRAPSTSCSCLDGVAGVLSEVPALSMAKRNRETKRIRTTRRVRC